MNWVHFFSDVRSILFFSLFDAHLLYIGKGAKNKRKKERRECGRAKKSLRSGNRMFLKLDTLLLMWGRGGWAAV